jgi:hypothetical protein
MVNRLAAKNKAVLLLDSGVFQTILKLSETASFRRFCGEMAEWLKAAVC